MESHDNRRNVTAASTEGPHENSDDALLKLNQVLAIVAVSKSHWYSGIASDRYPKPVKLYGRCVRWRSSDIRNFINSLELRLEQTHG